MKLNARTAAILGALLASPVALAAGVVGKPEGFASSTTGGGNAKAVYPSSTDELIKYLGDDEARVIVINKEFDFRGTEGSKSETGCAPYGTGPKCQTAINQNNWCNNYQPDAPKVQVSYDQAATLGITVGSNKSIVGEGSSGVLRGKGLRLVSGANNVIIQNIKITELNPEYVWGGDAITLDDTDNVWIDHVTTSLIGRQHIVLGNKASGRVSITNNHIDGHTSWSATCDDHHYWNIYLTGSNDLVTMKGNYMTYGSGREPKVKSNTLLHAVNNYFYQNSGHDFEVGSGAMILAEGNVFQNAGQMVDTHSGVNGQIFTSPSSSANKQCQSALGRSCVSNAFGSTEAYKGTDTGFFSNFQGKNIASAESTSSVQANVPQNAGYGKI